MSGEGHSTPASRGRESSRRRWRTAAGVLLLLVLVGAAWLGRYEVHHPAGRSYVLRFDRWTGDVEVVSVRTGATWQTLGEP